MGFEIDSLRVEKTSEAERKCRKHVYCYYCSCDYNLKRPNRRLKIRFLVRRDRYVQVPLVYTW
jgi:hypothetical protein